MANQVLLPPDLKQNDQAREPKLLAEIIDEPAWKTIAGNIYDLLYPQEAASSCTDLQAHSGHRPDGGEPGSRFLHYFDRDPRGDYRRHLVGVPGGEEGRDQEGQTVTNIDVPQYMPVAPNGPQMGGGGGGGSHDIIQAPKGRLPKAAEQPITPPMVIQNDHPKTCR